jgi:Porphyromonas-type peptidyl-arginine deiminase
MPPEWHPQDWLWIGFPHDAAEWPGTLAAAQAEIAAFASAVADSGQEVRLVVRDAANEAAARGGGGGGGAGGRGGGVGGGGGAREPPGQARTARLWRCLAA